MTPSDQLLSGLLSGELMVSSVKNIAAYLEGRLPDWAQASVKELLEKRNWKELNDRFYRELEFGTGGIRGRTIGAVATAAETGKPGPFGTPEHAAVGSNMMNDFTLARAVIGLFHYTQGYLKGSGEGAPPRL